MTDENTKIIEINGVKMEIDLRHAKCIDHFRVGDRVKVLKKEYSSYSVHHGVIIGFEPFENLPTMIVCYAQISYSEAEIKFLYFNAETKDIEIVACIDDDQSALDKSDFVKQVDKKIMKLESDIQDLKYKRQYFLEKFQTYWVPAPDAVEEVLPRTNRGTITED